MDLVILDLIVFLESSFIFNLMVFAKSYSSRSRSAWKMDDYLSHCKILEHFIQAHLSVLSVLEWEGKEGIIKLL